MILLLSILCGESCLLVSCCVGDRCDMAGSDKNLGRSMRPGTEDWGWSSTGRILDGRMIGRSGYTVCGLHRAQEDEEHVFLGLASKPWLSISQFGPQNRQLRFGDLDLKITVTVSWFGHQNQADGGLSVVPQNQWEEYDTGHTSRSSGLLCLKASRDRVFHFASKLVEERRRVVHVTSSWMSHEDEVEDSRVDAIDCIRPFYPYFVIFVVLGDRGILVFWMSL
jgi:hypothetical protein